ncbi:group 1 truncated hemoglobin [uncultured Thalassolituus sp.]|uniref:group I truncated hemoglobin n=1 Tax=uncultured Thalassolituus sp. TaxID=285273 RepID=UPI0026375F5D|nr:group 1 truncated hemoglobin [uncultured Thalassolituus sp.]
MKKVTRTLLVSACLLGAGPAMATTLYDDLGGKEGIAVVVDGFINEISYDQNIVKFFAQTDIKRLREKLEEQLCMVSDGPCEYTGDSMEDVHAGMQITTGEFNRVVELLQNAMNQAGVAYPVQNRLIKRLAPMRPEIIHR